MSLSKEDKKKIIDTFGIGENDTGSAPVQVALLSENIRRLTGHLKENKKDFSSKRGLLMMVSLRKKLLRYLKRENEDQYKNVISRLGLKK